MTLGIFLLGFIVGYIAALVCLYFYDKYPDYLDEKRERSMILINMIINSMKGGNKEWVF